MGFFVGKNMEYILIQPGVGNRKSHARHYIRHNEITLSQEEFEARARPFVGLLFETFKHWMVLDELNKGESSWDTMSEVKKNYYIEEFFRLYTE